MIISVIIIIAIVIIIIVTTIAIAISNFMIMIISIIISISIEMFLICTICAKRETILGNWTNTGNGGFNGKQVNELSHGISSYLVTYKTTFKLKET